jgi:hypothetical protein
MADHFVRGGGEGGGAKRGRQGQGGQIAHQETFSVGISLSLTKLLGFVKADSFDRAIRRKWQRGRCSGYFVGKS